MTFAQSSANGAEHAESGDAIDDLRDYLHAALGDTSGYAHVGVGLGGHFDNVGTYSFKRADGHRSARWVPRHYAWPAEADRLVDELDRARAEYDVYLCPYLMRGAKRTPDAAIDLCKVHADVDDGLDMDKVTALGAWAVASGSAGHAHLYVSLAQAVSLPVHRALAEGLRTYLGADDKIAPNDVLRPPGTFNHKGRARGDGSTAVEWLMRPTSVRWDVDALAYKLGVELPDPDAPPAGARTRSKAKASNAATDPDSAANDHNGQPFDLNAYPRVKRALADVSNPPDRSVDTMKVVAAVHDAGLTVEHARWAVAQRADLWDRLDRRRDDDVLRCWLKMDSDRRAATAAAATAAVSDVQYKDAYVSERIAAEYLADFVHSSAFGWRRWDGRRWAAIDRGIVLDAVRQAVIEIHTTAVMGGAGVASLQEIDALLGERRITGILKLCAGIRTVEASDFDQHPDLLNVGNGVIELSNGDLLPHDRDLMMTTLTPTNYVPGATHPDWDAALQAVPAEVAVYLQDRFGQGCTGHPPDDDKLLISRGNGSNGKTTLYDAITDTLGNDHAVVVPDRVLLARPGDHPTELTTLRGARLALVEELPGGGVLDIKRLKTICGTGKITARQIAKDNITWTPTHSLFLTSNYSPHVPESDYATWRRLLMVEFPFTYRGRGAELRGPHDRRGDPNLRERLRRGDDGQHEAVLVWLVDGARRWYQAGGVMPAEPPQIVEATAAWRRSADLLLRFADEHLSFDEPTAHVMASELYMAFVEWLTANGHRPWSDQHFSERLQSHSALAEYGLERTRVRKNTSNQQTLSRRRFASAYDLVPGRYQAWLGVRFLTNADNTGNDDDSA